MLPRFSSLRLSSGSTLGARSNGRIHEERKRETKDRGSLLSKKNLEQPEVPGSSHNTERLSSWTRMENRVVSTRRAVTTLRNNENSVRSVRQRAHAPIYGSSLAFMAAAGKYASRNPRSARCFMYARFPSPFSLVCRASDSRKLASFPTCSHNAPLPDLPHPTRPLFSLSEPSRLIWADSCYIPLLAAFRVHALWFWFTTRYSEIPLALKIASFHLSAPVSIIHVRLHVFHESYRIIQLIYDPTIILKCYIRKLIFSWYYLRLNTPWLNNIDGGGV